MSFSPFFLSQKRGVHGLHRMRTARGMSANLGDRGRRSPRKARSQATELLSSWLAQHTPKCHLAAWLSYPTTTWVLKRASAALSSYTATCVLCGAAGAAGAAVGAGADAHSSGDIDADKSNPFSSRKTGSEARYPLQTGSGCPLRNLRHCPSLFLAMGCT